MSHLKNNFIIIKLVIIIKTKTKIAYNAETVL